MISLVNRVYSLGWKGYAHYEYYASIKLQFKNTFISLIKESHLCVKIRNYILGSYSPLLSAHNGKDIDSAIFFRVQHTACFCSVKGEPSATGLESSQNRKRKPQCYFDTVKVINSTGVCILNR